MVFRSDGEFGHHSVELVFQVIDRAIIVQDGVKLFIVDVELLLLRGIFSSLLLKPGTRPYQLDDAGTRAAEQLNFVLTGDVAHHDVFLARHHAGHFGAKPEPGDVVVIKASLLQTLMNTEHVPYPGVLLTGPSEVFGELLQRDARCQVLIFGWGRQAAILVHQVLVFFEGTPFEIEANLHRAEASSLRLQVACVGDVLKLAWPPQLLLAELVEVHEDALHRVSEGNLHEPVVLVEEVPQGFFAGP